MRPHDQASFRQVPAGKEEVSAGGLVTGVGHVHGRAVAIVANDATGQLGKPYDTCWHSKPSAKLYKPALI